MEDRKTLYLEPTIISYYTAKPSENKIIRGRQEVTKQWWDHHRIDFDLVISKFVVAEISRGDKEASIERMNLIEGIPMLTAQEETYDIAEALIQAGNPLPKKSHVDALHIAVAAFNGIDYLLTWNCTHIANAILLPKIEKILEDMGYFPPRICTPDQLLGV